MPLLNEDDLDTLFTTSPHLKTQQTKLALKNQNIRNLMQGENPILPLQEFAKLSFLQRIILENETIYDFLTKKFLSLDDAFSIRNRTALDTITSPAVLSLVFEKKIFSLEELIRLKPIEVSAVSDPAIRAMLSPPLSLITKKDLSNFSSSAQNALTDPGIMHFVAQKKISLKRLIKIKVATYNLLTDPFTRHLFLDEPSCLNSNQKGMLWKINTCIADIFLDPAARQCIAELNPTSPLITLEQVFTLRQLPARLFCQEGIRRLLRHGILTLNGLNNVDTQVERALEDRDTVDRLIQGTLTLTEIVANRAERAQNRFVNDRQSTHNASVHRTTAETILNLNTEYGKKVSSSGDVQFINQIKQWVESITAPSDSKLALKKNAAQHYIGRLQEFMHKRIVPVEAISKVSFTTFLALAWLAIQDDEKRIGTKEDALSALLDALYEIQRGYNLDESGIDNNQIKDSYICSGGSFNKLCEKLLGHHPLVQLQVITEGGASSKLPIVVRTVIETYLLDDKTENRAEKLDRLSIDGVSSIWDEIEPIVFDEIFQEFGEAFNRNKNHSKLVELVSYGAAVTLTEQWITKLREKYTETKQPSSKNLEEEFTSTLLANEIPDEEVKNNAPFNEDWEETFFNINSPYAAAFSNCSSLNKI